MGERNEAGERAGVREAQKELGGVGRDVDRFSWCACALGERQLWGGEDGVERRAEASAGERTTHADRVGPYDRGRERTRGQWRRQAGPG
jgi:hypothetical protein